MTTMESIMQVERQNIEAAETFTEGQPMAYSHPSRWWENCSLTSRRAYMNGFDIVRYALDRLFKSTRS